MCCVSQCGLECVDGQIALGVRVLEDGLWFVYLPVLAQSVVPL